VTLTGFAWRSVQQSGTSTPGTAAISSALVIAVSDAEMAQINIKSDDFHGEWNYTISPTQPTA
jgi:phosphomevalonate kinase